MDALKEHFDQQSAEIKADYDERKAQYQSAKDNIDLDIRKIYEENEEKVNAMSDQRTSLLDSIEQYKEEMVRMQEEYKQQLKNLEDERNQKLEQLAAKQEADLLRITQEYENLPSKKLQEVRYEFAAKQREYEENTVLVTSRRQGVDEQEQQAIDDSEATKAEADEKLAEITGQYLTTREENDNLETELSKELERRQNELNLFKKELADEVQAFKDEHAQKLEELNADLGRQLKEKENFYLEKQKDVEAQYDEKVKQYRSELQAKKDNLDSLINEINSRKELTQKECATRFNLVAEKTRNVQQELDELVNKNEIARNEYDNSLKQKRSAIDSEIDGIKSNYDMVLEEKRSAYERYIEEVNAKCDDIRSEISELNKKKDVEASKFEAYEVNKRSTITDLSRETTDYVNNIEKRCARIRSMNSSLFTIAVSSTSRRRSPLRCRNMITCSEASRRSWLISKTKAKLI